MFDIIASVSSKVLMNQAIPFDNLGISGLDFYGFLLPWIFTFAIVYGLLVKANIFGNANRQVSIALSFVIAFFVTGLGGPQLAMFFTNLFGGASVFLGGILVILLFVSMLGYAGNGFKHIAALVLVIIIGAILFLASTGSMTGGQIYIDSYTATVIFWIIIIIVAAYLITRGGSGQTSASEGGQPPAGH